MSDPIETPTSTPAATLPDAETLVFLIGNVTRWKMLRELAAGETRTISELAEAGGCGYHSARNHLLLMRDAGLVEQGRGSLYQLPARYLPAPGRRHVDFGHCLLRYA